MHLQYIGFGRIAVKRALQTMRTRLG
jgi:hypothetical protein